MKVHIITGSRHWRLAGPIAEAVLPADILLVGDCPTGADRLARRLHDNLIVFEADWDKHGNGAGPRRNAEMVTRGLELRAQGFAVSCWAFPMADSRGTLDTTRRAREAGIVTHVYSIHAGGFETLGREAV